MAGVRSLKIKSLVFYLNTVGIFYVGSKLLSLYTFKKLVSQITKYPKILNKDFFIVNLSNFKQRKQKQGKRILRKQF
jgi:hypothetical protein